LLLLLAVG
jgi:hypothetical protein